MSTRIYNGYKLPKKEAHEIIPYIRDEIGPVLIEAMKAQFREWYKTPENYKKLDLFERARAVKKTGENDPMADFEIIVTVFPCEEYMLMMLFGGHKKAQAALEGIEGVSEFFYWDNSDEPEDVPYEEFSDRGDVWDEVLNDGGSPAANGLTIDIHSHYPLGADDIWNETK